MKKILLLVNENFALHAMSFVIEMCKKQTCRVNALFVGSNSSLPGEVMHSNVDLQEKSLLEGEQPTRYLVKMELFNEVCRKNNIEGYIQLVTENFLDTIIDETAFADVVVCDDKMDIREFSMNSFISSSHCPVILVPKECSFFSSVVFTYDGNISSIYAMKQFAYLFTWAQSCKVFLVSVLPPNILQMEYDSLVREWIGLHYENSEVVILKGEIKAEMAHFINSQKHSLVVMGAFGRSALSRLFKESLAPNVLKTTLAPVFISHN